MTDPHDMLWQAIQLIALAINDEKGSLLVTEDALRQVVSMVGLACRPARQQRCVARRATPYRTIG